MEASENTNDILFAVIIPTYNRPTYLTDALDSLLAQTYGNWLAVVVNDASTADYSGVENIYTDPRIRFLRRDRNGGCNAARNTGIDYAIGQSADYITMLDDEETFVPECLAEGRNIIKQHPEYGWFISNNFGEQKKCANDITGEKVMDWIDDYVYGKTLRGDKTHMISTRSLGTIRFDGRYRASNMWPFYMALCFKTRIYAYPYRSKHIQYLEGGITRTDTRYPKTLLETYSRFARHWFVIKNRPYKLAAYKYLVLELLKTPKRLFILLLRLVNK